MKTLALLAGSTSLAALFLLPSMVMGSGQDSYDAGDSNLTSDDSNEADSTDGDLDAELAALGFDSDEQDGDDNNPFATRFDSDDADGNDELQALMLSLGLTVGEDGSTEVTSATATCDKGDIGNDLYDTDAWRECQEKTGKSPLEFLAQAFGQAFNAGNDDTADHIAQAGQRESEKELASGISQDQIDADTNKGFSEAAGA